MHQAETMVALTMVASYCVDTNVITEFVWELLTLIDVIWDIWRRNKMDIVEQ